MAAKGSDSNSINITRIYEAPIQVVWQAWVDPAQAAQWWGPRGFTLTTHSKDFRAGGGWHYTMHGPDGVDYPNKTKYLEVKEPSLLVYDHGGYDDRPPLFRVTVRFTEVKAGTQMDMTMTLPTPEAAAETRKFIKKAGGDATWDRLGEYLDKKATDQEIFLINRSFAAPINTLFSMWTMPEHVEKWMVPTGFSMSYLKADIREGGSSRYVMTDGKVTMYGQARYLEIRRPDRIVYTQQFCDEQGNVSRHPLAPTWPETMRTTVTLTEERPAQTRVTLRWDIEGKATAEERATFVQGKAGMTGGWTGSFDQLDDYLAKSQ